MDHIEARVAIRCLGSFSIKVGDNPVQHWKTSRSRSLFQYLLINRNKLVLKERLYEVLWPHATRSPSSSSLKVTVHTLRRILEAHGDSRDRLRLAYQDYGYILRVDDGVWTDFIEFEKLAERAQTAKSRGNRSEAIHLYQRAIGLYRGDFLAGETADWVIEQREWLRSISLHALRYLSREALRQGESTAAATYCRRTLEIDPSDEDTYRTLMTMHAQRGELGQVKRWHALCTHRLREHLDVDPDEETNRLLVRALRGELVN